MLRRKGSQYHASIISSLLTIVVKVRLFSHRVSLLPSVPHHLRAREMVALEAMSPTAAALAAYQAAVDHRIAVNAVAGEAATRRLG